MAANAEAYNRTYNDHAEPGEVTAQEVASALMRQTVATRQDALRVLRGLRYNLVANNGHDAATDEVLDGLLSLAYSAIDILSPWD
jgi:hypothetical protein